VRFADLAIGMGRRIESEQSALGEYETRDCKDQDGQSRQRFGVEHASG
jgi:hypothetical protein